MRDGFIKVAAVTPEVKVADIAFNLAEIKRRIREAAAGGAKLIVFPELSISAYSCRDIFFNDLLLQKSSEALLDIAAFSTDIDALIFVGLPISHKGKLYNVAAAVNKGHVLGLVPKLNVPNYGEFYETRQFIPGFIEPTEIRIGDEFVPFGAGLLFECVGMPELKVGVEICEDLWVPMPPSTQLALNGASVIANLSASNEITGKSAYRRELVADQSARSYSAYIYANAAWEESTTDVVFSGHNVIAEAGTVLKESKLFTTGVIMTEIDLNLIKSRREHMSTFPAAENDYADTFITETLYFDLEDTETVLTRFIDPHPFVPSDNTRRERRCDEILDIQTYGLMKRIKHTGAKTAVIGISGGLDSTLALIVAVRAFDKLGLSREGVIGVTMPGFGTTDRTYDNAVSLIHELGISFKEINISEAVRLHFKEIEHDESVHDTTYENCQARMRTMLLMDTANKFGGLVVGTGDMSELALGWATYNGDHMSMYGVNAGVPKTLVRYLVAYYADICGSDKVKSILYDVLDTPVSPELLPPETDGSIAQRTEDLVGPYELHDFFLYHFLRNNSSPKRIFRLAEYAFGDSYDRETILKWEKNFFRRFFSQQFKRSCLPDGPKVGTVCLSPRGDLRMASDTCSALWLAELEEL
ncbi:MAG: NAD(+) synthase [Eubacteriales bacterium]|nr:NAD(+) synthase [Eubacteriales bacterium]